MPITKARRAAWTGSTMSKATRVSSLRILARMNGLLRLSKKPAYGSFSTRLLAHAWTGDFSFTHFILMAGVEAVSQVQLPRRISRKILLKVRDFGGVAMIF